MCQLWAIAMKPCLCRFRSVRRCIILLKNPTLGWHNLSTSDNKCLAIIPYLQHSTLIVSLLSINCRGNFHSCIIETQIITEFLFWKRFRLIIDGCWLYNMIFSSINLFYVKQLLIREYYSAKIFSTLRIQQFRLH